MRTLIFGTLALALTATAVTAKPFRLVDRNRDGVISQREFIRAYGPELDIFQFRHIDRNRDGVLDAREIRRERNAPSGPIQE